MATVSLRFTTPLNESLQNGDTAYWTSTASSGGFNTSGGVNLIGEVTNVIREIPNTISAIHFIVVCDNTITNAIPPQDSFIMFAKDSSVNTANVLGYYAEVELKNNSKEKEVEIFSLGSDIFESSK